MVARVALILLLASVCILQLAGSGSVGPIGPAHADDDDDDDDEGRPRRRPPIVLERRRAIPRPVSGEIVAMGLTEADAARLRGEGYQIIAEFSSALLGRHISRLRPPAWLGLDRALRRARSLAPSSEFARNDKFSKTRMRFSLAGTGCGRNCETFRLTAWSAAAETCPVSPILGVIDTAVDMTHDSLKGANVTLRTLRSSDRTPSRADHGTAVVSLLAGNPTSPVAGVLPRGRIVAADAFHQDGRQEKADVFDLVAALDWLNAERAQVINLSFSGPDNPALKTAITQMRQRGVIIVAAAGQPDSGANAGFPARYDGVVAVSAIDMRLRPSPLAARGKHIAFSAPGVGVNVAAPGNKTRLVDGTSFATPFVAAAYAMGLDPARRSEDIERILSTSARDLGAPGRDPIYGWGLIQYDGIHCRQ
jgi:hypothetical protein